MPFKTTDLQRFFACSEPTVRRQCTGIGAEFERSRHRGRGFILTDRVAVAVGIARRLRDGYGVARSIAEYLARVFMETAAEELRGKYLVKDLRSKYWRALDEMPSRAERLQLGVVIPLSEVVEDVAEILGVDLERV